MSLVNRFFGTLAACALGATLATTALAETKIAVVDTQRAVMQTEDGLRAQATLRKHFDKRQRDLDDQQIALKKEQDDIEKQRAVLSKEALQARFEKLQKELSDLQARFVDYNKEMQKKQSELLDPITQKTNSIISRIARQNGYDMVIDRQMVPYFRSDLDLTDRVITEYNQTAEAAPAGSGKPAGAPAPAAPKKP